MTTATAERVDLEQLLDELAPCDWQSGHARTAIPCDEQAVALMWQGCEPGIRWRACASASGFVQRAMAHPTTCRTCDAPTRKCWRVVPI